MIVRPFIALFLIAVSATAADPDSPRCANSQFLIDTNFESGNFDKCKVRSDGSFVITIRPEDHKVVTIQPWFAFRVTTKSPGELRIRLRFPDAYARYWPKLSIDGETWTRAAESSIDVPESKEFMDITMSLSEGPLWIAAQELLTTQWYGEWLDEIRGLDDIKIATIGQSIEGRPIQLVKTANKPEAIILLGRQHPAEIPGAMAMRDFVEVVLANSELARQYWPTPEDRMAQARWED